MDTAIKQQSWWQRLFGLPAGTNLVYWMISFQYNAPWQIGGFIGFMVLFTLAFRTWEAALAMILGMFLHELGHYAIFRRCGIQAVILFLFPLGAVAAPKNKDEDTRSDQLHWWDIGWLLQAGPTMNVFQMVVGVAMNYFGIWPEFAKQMVVMNGTLAIMNLLPLWNMDGGQLFHVIFSSMVEDADKLISILMTLVSFGIVAELLVHPFFQGLWQLLGASITHFGVVMFFVLMTAGVWHKQGKDNPLHSSSTQAMNLRQVLIQIVWYLGLVATAFILWGLI